MTAFVAVIAGAGIAVLVAVRYLARRYRELYGSEDPPYEDPPVIPIQGSHGGLM